MKKIFLVIGLWVILLPVSGQLIDSTNAPFEEIVVTAQRQQQNSLWVPYSIKKTDSLSFFKSNSRTTPELLQSIGGVFVQKTNHGGGSAIIRGLTGNQTLTLIDGIRLNNSTFRYGPNQYLNTIDPFIINHIEIARGTGSVQYGTDAMGGVIHVLSNNPEFALEKPAWHGMAVARYTSGGMEKTGRVELMHATKRTAISGGFTYRNFGDLIGGDTTGRQSPSGYDEIGFNGKAKFLLSSKIQLTLSHQTTAQKEVPIYHKVVLEKFRINQFDVQKRQLQYARLTIRNQSRVLSKVEFTTSLQRTIEERENQKINSSKQVYERDKVNTVGATLEITSNFNKKLSINTGIELYADKVNSARKEVNSNNGNETLKRGLYPDGSLYNNYSIYALVHFKDRRWAADAGLRLNTFSINLVDSTLGNLRLKSNVLVWNAATTYRFYKQHFLYLTFSTGFRAPNIDDVASLGIVDFRYEVPSNNLRPEKSFNRELGYKFKANKIRGELAVYHMQLSDLITRLKVPGTFINGYQVYKKENIEQAFIRGGEAELTWTPAKIMNLTSSICYTYGKNKTNDEPLRRIPPLFFRSQLEVNLKSWIVAGELLLARKQTRLAKGDKEDNRIPSGGTPGWEVINFYLSKSFGHLKLNVSINNILNKDYRIHGSGINGLGRSASFTVRYSF